MTLSPLAVDQYRYQGTYLRDTVGVAIANVTEADCPRQRVAFSPPPSGAVSVDTVTAGWRAGEDGQAAMCLAQTRWRLPDAAGEHYLRARIVGASSGPQETFIRAIARKRAYVFSGIIGLVNVGPLGQHSYDAMVPSGGDTVTVVEVTTDGQTTVTKTTTEEEPGSLVRVRRDPGLDFAPVIGINTVIWESWPAIRAWAAVSLEDIDGGLYFGLSALQLIGKMDAERAIVDILIGARLTLRDVARTGADTCDGGVSSCTKKQPFLDGIAFGVVIDGTSVLSSILKAFGM